MQKRLAGHSVVSSSPCTERDGAGHVVSLRVCRDGWHQTRLLTLCVRKRAVSDLEILSLHADRIWSYEECSTRIVMCRRKRTQEKEGKETWGDADKDRKKWVIKAMLRGCFSAL